MTLPKDSAGTVRIGTQILSVNKVGIINTPGPSYGKYPAQVQGFVATNHPGVAPRTVDPHGAGPPLGGEGAVGAPAPLTPTGPTSAALDKTLEQRNASTSLSSLFASYGLGSLAPQILDYIKQGYDAQTTSYLLQQTPEFKQRFAGNELRKQAGLAVLSPSEYLATERAYKNTAAAFNLPQSFYDNPTDFTQLIGHDISPNEFQARASHAFQFAQAANPEARTMLQQYYGIDDSHIAAYFLDPTKAQGVLDRAASAVDIGAAGLRQGIGVNKGLAESYVDQGVTQQQAQSGFANAAQALQAGQLGIAQRFGSDLTATDVSNEFVTNLASARRKRDALNQNETALFQGNADTATRSFSQDNLGSF